MTGKKIKPYDIVLIGNYTKDTIVSPDGTRVVDGGGFNYGAHVAAMMKLRTAAVARVAREDFHVVRNLETLGVDVYPTATPESTCLKIVYRTSNVDERTLHVISTAGSYTPGQVADLESRIFIINSSFRGETGIDVVRALSAKKGWLMADVQGFIRVNEGVMMFRPWPEKEEVLKYINMLKTDAVEARMLTGSGDIRTAARMLADSGPDEIVLTHKDGLLVYAGGRYYEAPWLPEKLVGRSGRGDTCGAAYVAKRLSAEPEEATVWAAAVTSLKMEAEGPLKR